MIDMLARIVTHFAGMIAGMEWMQLLLVVGGTFLLLVLYFCQRADDNFDLRHLVADPATAKIDRFAFAYLVGLVVLTWALLFLANSHELSEWFAFVYVVYCGAPKTIEAIATARFGRPA